MIILEFHLYDDETNHHFKAGMRESEWKDLDGFYKMLKYMFSRLVGEMHSWKVEQHKTFETSE